MLTNPPDEVAEKTNQEVFQEAIEAIHANRCSLAHRLLLQVLPSDPDDIQIRLLLGWTAPNSTSAAFHFKHLLEKHPNNPQGSEILQLVSKKFEREGNPTSRNKNETKELITKTIAHLENSEVEGLSSGGEIRKMEEKTADRMVNRLGIRNDNHNVRQVRIPRSIRVAMVYLAGLTIAEILTTLSNPQIGLLLHGFLLVLLILHATLFSSRGEQKFLITLTLAPLIRLMSLSIPLLNFPLIYWYALIGGPLFLAAYLVFRMTGFKATQIGLNWRAIPWQLMIGLTGIIFGFIEYIILRPAPLIEALTWKQIWLPAIILLIFTGFLEEIIFRGIIQRGAAGTLGRYGIYYISVIFAIFHIGYHSVLDIIFVFLVALFFGAMVSRTGSILGVTISHGLTNIALYLIIPFLMNASGQAAVKIPQIETETTVIPIVWSIQGNKSTQINMDSAFIETARMNTQSDLIDVNSGVNLDWLAIKDRKVSNLVTWQSQKLDYARCKLEDLPRQELASVRSANIPNWHRI